MILFTTALLQKKTFFFMLLVVWGQISFGSYYVALRGMGQPKYKKDFLHFAYANPKAPKGGDLNLCTFRKFTTVNPYVHEGVSVLHGDLVFATLMKTARDNIEVAYPYLAESVKISPNHTDITFFLRKNAAFSTGTPVTSEDVVFSFQTLQQKGSVFWQSIGQHIDHVEILSPYVVKFVFRTPNKDLPYQIGMMPVFRGTNSEGGAALNGSGPYRIRSYEMGKFIVYERVPNWWGENVPCNKGFYNFDTLKVTYYSDSRVGFEAFKKGLVDWWKDERISNWYHGYDGPAFHQGCINRVTFDKPFDHGLTGLFINTRRPYLADRKVREALHLLFDFDWLNRTRFFSEYERNKSIFMSSRYGASEKLEEAEKKLLKTYKKELFPSEIWKISNTKKITHITVRERFSKALGLLKEAGWVPKNGFLVFEKTGERMKLDIVVGSPGHASLFQGFLQNLKKVGIQGSIISDWSRYTSRLRHLDFDMILHYHPRVFIPGSEQRFFWSSQWVDRPSTFNLAGVKDPVVDDLVHKIEVADNLVSLRAYTALLDRIIALGYYVIPGWVPQKIYVAYWRKLNVLHQNASLYDIDTWWISSLEKKVS